MSALLIRDLPEELHDRIKDLAQRNQRSLSAEVIGLLERALAEHDEVASTMPPPLVGTFPITNEWLDKAKNEGRA